MSRTTRVLIGAIAGIAIGLGLVSLRPTKAPAMKWDAIPTTIQHQMPQTPRDPTAVKPW